MKEGMIVYLIGGADVPEDVDLPGDCRSMGLAADQIELVGAHQGFFSVEDAWHYLVMRGCGRVSLLVADWQHRLAPLRPPVRLSG